MLTPIHDFLSRYAESDFLRCHMPGHKGELNTFDITEIQGADSLFESSGIIAKSERNAAKLFGADDTLFSCGGSTLAIQAMLAAAKLKSGKNRITAGRYTHKSLISGAVLLGLEIDWVYPSEFLSCVISPNDVAESITADTAAVFAASVDYYGGESDIRALAETAEGRRLPLLVDNAQGAYKVFTDDHPIKNGAAMTADSAHKTLPALTGAAYLHMKKPFDRLYMKSAMSLFGSTSPSYLMLDSLDLCNKFISEGSDRAKAAFESVGELKNRLLNFGYGLRPSDALRITIRSNNGFMLAEKLREQKIECELADAYNVVLLFSVTSDKNDCDRVYNALSRFEPEQGGNDYPLLRPKKALSPSAAFFGKRKRVDIMAAVGEACAEINAPCPPGVPLVMPGEIYDEEGVRLLSELGVKETSIVL